MTLPAMYYDHPVRQLFRSKPCPRPGLICDLVYNEPGAMGEPEFWNVRLYRDNFDSFSGEDRLVIFNWVSDIIRTIRIIEPNCFVEVYERMPK